MSARRIPPGRTERIAATSALVLAPHPDDEVVGCGGLLAALAAAGAAVRVLFLTDGGGSRGDEAPGEREAYRLRRRDEAGKAAEVLSLVGVAHLDFPDGELARHLEALGMALARVLLAQRPQLLFVPSPLELTADHCAAFAALHRLLSPLRAGEPLLEAAERLLVLAYEVNRPAYPDLLVDVSAQIPVIERAMACYGSQEERHPYLAAALGLRRYRTMTLDPSVSAAEGYRRLTLDDFRTHGIDALVARLGGDRERVEVRDGPTVSVVVRTRDRRELLAEALASLAASRYRRLELVLVNDGGATPELPAGFPFPVRRVEHASALGRAAAANAGIASATGEFVAFLDDDDQVEPEHFAVLAGLVDRTGVRVAYTDAAVGLYELDPESGWSCVERRLPYSRDFDLDLLLLDNYIPFNTLLVERDLLAEAGPLDAELPFFEDWELLMRLAQLAPFHHRAQVTCEYRHFRGGAQIFGESPRDRADFLAVKARVLSRHREALTPERLARVVARLRDEQVATEERLRSESSGRRDLAARAAAFEQDYHRLHGEVVSLQGERVRLLAALAERGGEIERLFSEESRLMGVLAERDEHLRATYAEIERLNALVREMESTRAWRLHKMLQRRSS